MKAANVMTSSVVTVTPQTSVSRLASLLSERRIGAAPVLHGGRLVGIVSEADLLHRYEIGTDCALRCEPWWLTVFGAGGSPERYVKSHAREVRDIMTREVATVTPATSLAEVATLLERRRIKQVPVMDRDQLVGIVSRADLVKALVAAAREGNATVPDDDIRRQLLDELRRQPWWRTELSEVSVREGVVTFAGVIQSENERTAARVAAQTVPGVRGVVDRRFAFRDLPTIV